MEKWQWTLITVLILLAWGAVMWYFNRKGS